MLNLVNLLNLPCDIFLEICSYASSSDLLRLAKTCSTINMCILTRIDVESIYKHEKITELINNQLFSFWLFELSCMFKNSNGNIHDYYNNYRKIAKKYLLSSILNIKDTEKIRIISSLQKGKDLETLSDEIVSYKFRNDPEFTKILWLPELIQDAEYSAFREILVSIPLDEFKIQLNSYILNPAEDCCEEEESDSNITQSNLP